MWLCSSSLEAESDMEVQRYMVYREGVLRRKGVGGSGWDTGSS